uniref:DOMON domain-containing protein n=1 Tax=Caenorhabditis tropicalis TaxID=1561998 RepID=A0A1I7TQV5_9PELO
MFVQISILFLALIGAASSQNNCKFSKNAVKATWKIENGALQIVYSNNRINNNQWTAIGFGPGMSNMNVIVFMVQNNQVTIRTGRTSGYGPPQFDNQSNVMSQMVNHSGSTLNALVSVPLNFNGMNVQNCQTWNFVQSGPINNGAMGIHTSRPDQVNNKK